MWLKKLEADRLRNLKAVRLAPAAGLTLVMGRNGQGKTSLLEAVYLLATGRSFRTRRLDDLIDWSGGPLRVAAEIENRLGRTDLAVLVDDGNRRLMAQGGETDLEAYLGRLDLVDLTGERMLVLRGGPVERRRFLDRGIVGLRPGFLRAIAEYRRALAQRNALLRQARPGTRAAELDAWDQRLIPAARTVHLERRQYAVRLAAGLGEIGRVLFSGAREIRLVYQPSPAAAGKAGTDRFDEVYADELGRGRGRDIEVGHTCLGPHRDEVRVELDGVDLRRFGSAGQVRAAMIALKLGKLSMLHEERGEAPLFLMDDFDTDLDEVRAAELAAFLHQGGFQALVATSKEGMAERLGVDFMKVRMDDGAAQIA